MELFPFSCPLLLSCSPSGSSSFSIGAIPNGSKLDRLLFLIGKRRRDKGLFCFGGWGLPFFGRKIVDRPATFH